MAQDKNPPAFPSGQFDGYVPTRGLTLRDWFAGQFALVAGATGLGRDNQLDAAGAGKIAAASYMLADAMLAVRDAPTPSTKDLT